jgi:flagellar hook-associated protein 2
MDNRISLNVSGIDTDSIIEQMMTIERRPLVSLQTQQTQLTARKAAWTAIKTQLDAVSSKLATLIGSTTFSQKTASSSDSSVLSATAASSSAEGTYQIQVTSLATAQAVQSSAFSSDDDPRGVEGTVTLNGKSIDVAATDSLQTIAAKINATTDVGATAAVLQTGTNEYKMIITSSELGVAGAMTFGGDMVAWKDLGVITPIDEPNEIVEAADAAFTVNGIQFTRSGNSVADAIPGLTLNLLEATDPVSGEGGKTTLTVGYNDQAIVDGVKSFITEYNNLLSTAGRYTTWDADTRGAGTLFGDSLVTRLLAEVRSSVFREVAGAEGGYNSLQTVGISTGLANTFSREGKLTLDETKLRDVLKAERSAVAVLFGAKAANVALSSRGSTATASSALDGQHPASSAINGDTSSVLWGAGGGWSDGTPGDFNDDWLEVDFGASRTIDKISVYTLDSTQYPAATYGLKDFSLKYWTGTEWAALGNAVTGNTLGMKAVTFSAVTTQKVRLYATASNDNQYARVVELEAYQQNDGAFNRLDDVMDRYADSDGFVSGRETQLDDENRYLSRQIENMQTRLDQRMTTLRKQFTDMEVALQKLNTQSAWLTQQIQAILGTQT